MRGERRASVSPARPTRLAGRAREIGRAPEASRREARRSASERRQERDGTLMMRRGSALDAEAMDRGLGREATLGCSLFWWTEEWCGEPYSLSPNDLTRARVDATR